MRMIAEVGCENTTGPPLRPEESASSSLVSLIAGDSPEPFHGETVDVIEINTDKRISAIISFDADDSTLPSQSSIADTWPAKRAVRERLVGHLRVRSSRSTGANFPRRRRTG